MIKLSANMTKLSANMTKVSANMTKLSANIYDLSANVTKIVRKCRILLEFQIPGFLQAWLLVLP